MVLALVECSARPYAELIKSNIPSSSSLLPARSTASRPSPLYTLGVFSFGPTAATPTKGEILVHLGATSRKPRSAKRKKPSSSEKDRSVPAKVQKLGESPPSPVQEPEPASPPLAKVRNSGASPPPPAQEPEQGSSPSVVVHKLGVSPPFPAPKPERGSSPLAVVQKLGASPPSPAPAPERASSPLVLTSLPSSEPDAKAKGLSGVAVKHSLMVMPITVWNPPSDNAKSPPRGMAAPKRKKPKPKGDTVKDSLLSNPKLATGAISSILLESNLGRSKGLLADEALALSFQGIVSVSPWLCLCWFSVEH